MIRGVDSPSDWEIDSNIRALGLMTLYLLRLFFLGAMKFYPFRHPVLDQCTAWCFFSSCGEKLRNKHREGAELMMSKWLVNLDGLRHRPGMQATASKSRQNSSLDPLMVASMVENLDVLKDDPDDTLKQQRSKELKMKRNSHSWRWCRTVVAPLSTTQTLNFEESHLHILRQMRRIVAFHLGTVTRLLQACFANL